MRWRMQSLIALGLVAAWSAPALACSFWFSSTFLRLPTSPVISAGLQNWENWRTISVDAAIKAGDKVVVRPGVGSCGYTGEGSSDNQMVYGANVGANVWNDAAGKISVNVQAGLEYAPFDGGNERNIPIGAAAQYAASEMLALFAGAAMNMYAYSYDDGFEDVSGSSSEVSIFAGAAILTGNFQLTGGITSSDGEIAINIGAGMSLGSASNAIRRLGSLFHK